VTWPHGRSRDGGIDEIPLPDTRGRLWLCGKHVVGPDPQAALSRVGATTVVCLNEKFELAGRYPGYVEWLQNNGVWFPIPDMHAPPLADAEVLLADLRDRLHNDERLLMHCGAGKGRAGTMAAALLITMGAIDPTTTVSRCRPGAGPEVGAQAELLNQLWRSRTG
jgi:hypothetical protein